LQVCTVDGFINRLHLSQPNWRQMMVVALRWARRQGFTRARARLSVEVLLNSIFQDSAAIPATSSGVGLRACRVYTHHPS
jgi:hypothetical protein